MRTKAIALSVAWAAVVLVFCNPALGGDVTVSKAELKALREENQKKQTRIDALQEQVAKLQAELAILKKQLQDLKRRLEEQARAEKKKAAPVQDSPVPKEWATFKGLRWGKNTVRLGESLTIGQVRVRPIKVTFQYTYHFDYASRAWRRDIDIGRKVLVLHCEVANISKGRVFNPWGGKSGTSVIDNFGNHLDGASLGGTSFLAPRGKRMYRRGKDLKAGQKRTYHSVYRRPVTVKATSFIWRIAVDLPDKGPNVSIYVPFLRKEIK